MKLFALVIFTALALSVVSFSRTTADELTGKWTVMADAGSQVLTIGMELKQVGEAFTGSTSSDMGNGTIDGGKVTGKSLAAVLHAEIQGTTVDFKMEGTIEGDKITGNFVNPQFGSIPYTATRNK